MDLKHLAETAVDSIYSRIPYSPPSPDKLTQCKLIAHRGVQETGAFENTMEAFNLCLEHQVWGMEFDVRWTKDQKPIVLHDRDATRVFGRNDVAPANMTLDELRRELPQIPTLGEVISKFGGQVHLMIEIKEAFDLEGFREKTMAALLKDLSPGDDYHLLTLDPELFTPLAVFPKMAFLGVAELNTRVFADYVLRKDWGGLTGHYWLLNHRIQLEIQRAKKKFGTGFISSPNVLYREINRDAEWLFTNYPLRLKKHLP